MTMSLPMYLAAVNASLAQDPTSNPLAPKVAAPAPQAAAGDAFMQQLTGAFAGPNAATGNDVVNPVVLGPGTTFAPVKEGVTGGAVLPGKPPAPMAPAPPTFDTLTAPPSAAPSAGAPNAGATEGPMVGPPAAPAHPPVSFIGGGGVIPAHEVERRGPSLLRAQGEANAMTEGAILGNTDRTEHAAEQEAAMYYEQQRLAQARQDAAESAAAERAAELQRRQQDFDQSVTQLSQMSVDPNRFWASRSTPQKISGIISIALGGFLQGAHGGPNAAMDIVNQAIDRDVDAQKFAYSAARDKASARQTAFGMAIQKYGSEDAAGAMAKAAALDVAALQVQQFIAKNKGTEAANRAAVALAQLQQEKMQQIAQGVAFVPATQAPRMYMSPEGIPMTETEAKAYYTRQREMGFELGKQELGQEGALRQEFAKGMIAQGGKTDEGARHISQQLQQAGVPQAKASLTHALRLMNESPGGVGEAAVRGVLPTVLGQKILPEQANAREQAFQIARADLIHALTGAGMSNEERQNYYNMMGSAATPEARRRTLQMGLEKLAALEANAKAGASPAAQQTYDEQRKSAGKPAYENSLQTYGGK